MWCSCVLSFSLCLMPISLSFCLFLCLSVQIWEEKRGEKGGKSSSAATEVRHSEWSWVWEDERREGKVRSFDDDDFSCFKFADIQTQIPCIYRVYIFSCLFLLRKTLYLSFVFPPDGRRLFTYYSHGNHWNQFINISAIPVFYLSLFPLHACHSWALY